MDGQFYDVRSVKIENPIIVKQDSKDHLVCIYVNILFSFCSFFFFSVVMVLGLIGNLTWIFKSGLS